MSVIRCCLVTGGSGFLGKRLVRELLARYAGAEVRVLSRSENEIAELLTVCANDPRIQPIVGDVRDDGTIAYALRGVDTIFHLAAMKHIDLCEANVTEAISTNVTATAKLLDSFGGDTFVSMSTDKVTGAIGCYGATKLLLEKLTLERARRCQSGRYMVVRSGNIFGSAGSVIPKWIRQIGQSNRITITDPRMTRFFIDSRVLASFIVDKAETGETGTVYIPDQVIVRLDDLAKAVIDTIGNEDTRIDIRGIRESEKMHERLFYRFEKNVVSDEPYEASGGGGPDPGSMDKVRSWLKEYVAEYALV